MFYCVINEPAHKGYPQVVQIVATEKKSQRDNIVRHVNQNAREFAEFKRDCPWAIVPASLHWGPDTTAKAIPAGKARKLIGNNEPWCISDGWSTAYAYEVCTIYAWKIYDKREHKEIQEVAA